MKKTVLTLFAGLACCGVAAQEGNLRVLTEPQPMDPEWEMPRTEHGHPDMQGTWWFGSRTPLQRPARLEMKRTYTAEEAAEVERNIRQRLDQQAAPLDPDRGAPEQGSRIGQEADDAFLGHWQKPELLPVNGEYRTSVIIDPPNGRLPLNENFQDYHAKVRAAGLGMTDGPEGQPLSGRCLMFGAVMPNLTPLMMNPHMQIIQTEDYVVIMSEMIHDARIIRLNDTHFESAIPKWMGDSVGRWEGDTLVVHSKNFRPEQSASRMFLPLSEEMQITERYTLVGDNEIHYAFIAEDPQAYTQPVTGERIISRNDPGEFVYEYGCHEGNYSLPGILRAARRADVEASLGL
ncbi:MAG: hypothetical protein MI746_16190 [Pseudomonadales bacterium]|nr:hypothetical protein [Pseudomonadales bacterium]